MTCGIYGFIAQRFVSKRKSLGPKPQQTLMIHSVTDTASHSLSVIHGETGFEKLDKFQHKREAKGLISSEESLREEFQTSC